MGTRKIQYCYKCVLVYDTFEPEEVAVAAVDSSCKVLCSTVKHAVVRRRQVVDSQSILVHANTICDRMQSTNNNNNIAIPINNNYSLIFIGIIASKSVSIVSINN